MKKIAFLLFIILTTTAAWAQNTYNCEIKLLENKEETALFSVTVDVDKKADVEKCACEALLTTLLLEGVEGFYQSRPLSNKKINYWRNEINLFKNEDNYLKYTTHQLENEPIASSSGKAGTVYVMLDHEKFLRYLERYGAINK